MFIWAQTNDIVPELAEAYLNIYIDATPLHPA